MPEASPIRVSPDLQRRRFSTVPGPSDPGDPDETLSQPKGLASGAMSIPRAQHSVPPPLPPPNHIPVMTTGHDPGWQWGNDPNGADFGRATSVRPGSSLLGGSSTSRTAALDDDGGPYREGHAADLRRGSSVSTIVASRTNAIPSRENMSQIPTPDSRRTSNYSLEGERHLQQRTLEASSNTYDKQLLSRIGGPNANNSAKRQSISFITNTNSGGSSVDGTSGNTGPAQARPSLPSMSTQLASIEQERRGEQLRPLCVPDEQRPPLLDSPASSRWPNSAAVSPGFNGHIFWAEHGPSEGSLSRCTTRHGSLTFDDSVSQRAGSYDQSMFSLDETIDDGRMGSLNLQDRSPGGLSAKAGLKRRASSPPREAMRDDRLSVSSASTHSDIQHQRSITHLPNRSRPSTSISSASSLRLRHGSLGSSLGVASITSSATSYNSGRTPSNAPQSTSTSNGEIDPRLECFAASGHNAGPDGPSLQHLRNYSTASHAGLPSPYDEGTHSRTSSVSQAASAAVYVCECCPKKPKKFETREELRLHASEKQYTCAYCSNRFKNKNEAERHQNSLHLRRHSWSCAALAGIEAAFHPSTASNADTCGYCGEEFANPPQWDLRAEHLNHVHKFGECNQAKKFFRADHFRQHLKHSHAGTSGKWTNMLENACMKDEPLPEKRPSVSTSTDGLSGQAVPALMVQGISNPQQYGGS